MYADTAYGPNGGSTNVLRHAGSIAAAERRINSIQRDVPVLPFPDPLYKEQWYFVRLLLFFFLIKIGRFLLLSESIKHMAFFLDNFFHLYERILRSTLNRF